MRSYCHRENKGYMFSNRNMALDNIARSVLGSTNNEEPFKLCHTRHLVGSNKILSAINGAPNKILLVVTSITVNYVT
jgi:hypothetical protein